MLTPFFTTWIESLAQGWLKTGVKRIPVIQPPNMGWSVTGELTLGNTQKTVNLHCDLSHQIQTHTVQFDGVNNNVRAVGCRIITLADITWHVKGTKINRTITVQDGASISGEAQAVDVKIYDASLGTPPAVTNYFVSASVAPGIRGNTQQPPLYYPFSEINTLPGVTDWYGVGLATGENVRWNIPPDIGAVSAYLTATDQTAALSDEDLQIVVHNRLGSIFSIMGANALYRYIPIPPGTTDIVLTNNSGHDLKTSCVIGIEG